MADDRPLPRCNEHPDAEPRLNHRYGAYYCSTCRTWLSPRCVSPYCSYCKGRPERSEGDDEPTKDL